MFKITPEPRAYIPGSAKTRQEICAAQVHGNYPVPLGGSDFLHRLHRTVISGVIYENIDAAELRLGRANQVLALLFIRHIGRDRRRTASRIADFHCNRFNFRFRSRSHHDIRAFACKFQAIARPIPRPPPVMTATCPDSNTQASTKFTSEYLAPSEWRSIP